MVSKETAVGLIKKLKKKKKKFENFFSTDELL